jgi:hypothetical protein
MLHQCFGSDQPNRSNIDPVPELTRSADIKLNQRVSLRRHAKAIAWSAPEIAAPSGPSVAKSPGDYIPPGGFVFLMT